MTAAHVITQADRRNIAAPCNNRYVVVEARYSIHITYQSDHKVATHYTSMILFLMRQKCPKYLKWSNTNFSRRRRRRHSGNWRLTECSGDEMMKPGARRSCGTTHEHVRAHTCIDEPCLMRIHYWWEASSHHWPTQTAASSRTDAWDAVETCRQSLICWQIWSKNRRE